MCAHDCARHVPDLECRSNFACVVTMRYKPYNASMAESADTEPIKIRRERDLYLRLLSLGQHTDVRQFLTEALALTVESVGARQGYIGLHGDDDAGHEWWLAHGFSDAQVRDVRALVSRGIIAAAMATGQTITTPSALLDPRFRDRDSVRLGRIEAVLCAPIGEDPPRGVLYLQGRATVGPFAAEECAQVELCARHLAPLAERFLAQERQRATTDPTQAPRQTLRADGVVGRSAALAAVLQEIALIAPLDVSVLLSGESGTGKTQLARVIHDNGPRASHPLVEVNCAALPEGLIESELFGALPGAHSTAASRARSLRQSMALCCSTRLAISHRARRQSCCNWSSLGSITRSAARNQSAPMCA